MRSVTELINRFENIKNKPPEERLKSESEEDVIKTFANISKIFVSERKRIIEERSFLKTKQFHRSVDSYLNDDAFFPDKSEKNIFGNPVESYLNKSKSFDNFQEDNAPNAIGRSHKTKNLGNRKISDVDLIAKPANEKREEDNLNKEINNDKNYDEEPNDNNNDKNTSKTQTKKIFDEFVESEKTYVNKLRICIRFYRQCLKERWIPAALKKLISDFNIFDDLKKIYDFHSRILLPTLISSRRDVEMFKQLLVENAEALKTMYQSYIKNRVGADKIINLHENFFNIKHNEFGSLIKINTGELNFPVSRITQVYNVYIEKMKKNYETVAKDGATQIDEEFKKERYWTIMTSIEDILSNINMDINSDSTPIVGLKKDISEKRGKLIKCDLLHVKYGITKTEVMKCYLHENYLVCARIVPRSANGLFDELYLCTAIPIKSLCLKESSEKDNKAGKHYFEVRDYNEQNKRKIIVFKKNCLEDHNNWKDAIRNLLEDQLRKEKEIRDDELSKSPGEEQQNSNLETEGIMRTWNPLENITRDEESEINFSFRVRQCLTDLMYTEKEYTKYLELFLQYISKHEDPFFISERFIKKTKIIHMFHSEKMLPAMEKSLRNEHWSLSASGDVLTENVNNLRLYNEFSPKTETSLDIVNNHKYVCGVVASKLGNNHDLYSFSCDPFYIILSYYCASCELVEIARDYNLDLKMIDTFMAAKDSTKKLLYNIKEKLYVERIKDCQVDMISQGELLASDIFDVSLGCNEPQQMRCFLFEKMIILTVIHLEERDGQYFHFHDAIGVRYLRYSHSNDAAATSFKVWHKNKIFKLFTFIANDSETVKKWIDTIIAAVKDTKDDDETSIQATNNLTFLRKYRIPEINLTAALPPSNEKMENFVEEHEENIAHSNQKDTIIREQYMDIVDNLIAKEEEYVRNLQSWVEGPHSWRIQEEIFKNTKYIYNFHSNVLFPALKRAEYNLEDLADVFIEHEPSFMLYNKKICIRNEKEDFVVVNQHNHFCENIIKSVLKEDDPLYAFFLDPWRSISLYINAFENLIRLSTEDSALIWEKLTATKNILEEVMKKCEHISIMEQFRYSKVDLMAQGYLRRQDNFCVTDSSDKSFEMSCFLFEKMLIFSVVSIENSVKMFDYHDSISFDSLGKTDPKSKSPESFQVYFKKFDNPKRYTVTGNTTTVKEWVEIIDEVLNAHFKTAKVNQATLQRNPRK